MRIVKVQYEQGEGLFTGREYSYFSEVSLASGDIVDVPVPYGMAKARVSEINVPEASIEPIRKLMKTITAAPENPAATKMAGEAPKALGLELLVDEWPEEPFDAELEAKIYESSQAVIKVGPESDEKVIALTTEVNKLLVYASNLAVKTSEDVKKVTNDLGMVGHLSKAIEAKRIEYVAPIDEHKKAVNEVFKTLLTPLKAADTLMRDAVLAYRKREAGERAKEEAINRLRMDAAQKEMELKGELTQPVELVEERAEQPVRYRAEAATAGVAKIPKWELIDFALLPDRFKMENATLIGKVVRAGEREIPGVRIWLEESLRVTTPQGDK
uniref:Uncharacterized protein n=1 Tax=viral metagenome TaxID=1070528 RepID=A0A6M3JT63_9ZZZZ